MTQPLLPFNSEDNQEQFHYYWGANYKYYADDLRYGKEGAPYEIGVTDMATEWDEGDGWFGNIANPGTNDNWLMPGITRKPLKKPLKYTEVTPVIPEDRVQILDIPSAYDKRPYSLESTVANVSSILKRNRSTKKSRCNAVSRLALSVGAVQCAGLRQTW